jgi:hypothetical protein
MPPGSAPLGVVRRDPLCAGEGTDIATRPDEVPPDHIWVRWRQTRKAVGRRLGVH